LTAIRNNTSPSSSSSDSSQAAEDLKTWLAKNRPLLDILLDSYCVVDLENRVVDFNVAFTELVGESYRKVSKIADFCELLKTELCPHQCPAKQIVTSQRLLRLDELKGQSKAFTHLQMILAGIPIFSDTQALVGSLITIRNVSAESELQKKYDERKRESVTDGLTRLYNKIFTETMLLKFVKSSLRDENQLSVAMIDIDHFKRVNDTHGHQAGDYVLALIAQLLQGESRDSDVVGRFGGEEFIVILSNSTQEGAKIFADRFRARVETTKVIFEGKHIPVTVSVGTATYIQIWQPGVNAERSMKELINRADTALYFAKANGRNQIRQYEKLPESKD
jgi:diguanylate cyclase (GGDEF)-like protein